MLHDAYGDGFVGGCCGGADGVAEKGAEIDWVGLGGGGGSGRGIGRLRGGVISFGLKKRVRHDGDVNCLQLL